MSDGLSVLERMVSAEIARQPLPSSERIRELINSVRTLSFCADVTDDEAEELLRILEERHEVTMQLGATLTGARWEPWLDAARPHINPYYWDRYKKLLVERGLSGHVIATLDQVTDRILGLLEDPSRLGRWDRRGMVVGHVQSGKTGNYAALTCKAADAGYKLVVVIAGVHNNLRNQTQIRLDEAFVGRDSARLLSKRQDQVIGVGRFDRTRRPVTFTNSLRDFNKTIATGIGVELRNLNAPALFVIKKNAATLKNLLEWLREHNARAGVDTIDAPMLLVDDEADNASINTKHGSGEVTRINSQIRDLLRVAERSCYVGYTATPFANIFIDPDSEDEMLRADLFPRDFIVSLDPPSNYFGPTRVFREDPESIIRHIEDADVLLPLKHKIGWQITGLPESLKKALRTFIVARAIRLARGQVTDHCSMLVNASRFMEVQRQLRNEIHEYLEAITASIRVNGATEPQQALRDVQLAALHKTWFDEYAGKTEFAWPAVQARLLDAAAPISVVEVNGRSSGSLQYGEYDGRGLSVVAVGGFSLSRGLTLEGLMVSYFLRNSMMYDTLMQMGRWFGYRTGYEDLCRIWMPEEAEGWYAHIADSIEELREELRLMEAAGATPEQFGLKVRGHPDSLMVTARNKMGTGELVRVKVGLANQFVETHTLRGDGAALNANRRTAHRLVQEMGEAGCPLDGDDQVRGGYLVRKVPARIVLAFISAFQNHRGSLLTDTAPLLRYIAERGESELAEWDVFFPSLQKADPGGITDSGTLGVPVNCQRRSLGDPNDHVNLRITSRQRVASRGIERMGLTDEQVAGAQREYRAANGLPEGGLEPNYPDLIYRRKREHPLLIVHLLAIGSATEDLHGREPVVAYSISFPATESDEEGVEYVVNTTWLRENYRDELDEDEMAGDPADE